MNDDPVYVGLTYSNDDIDEFMKHAGIENGFFTVRMGNREATQYYTKSETILWIFHTEKICGIWNTRQIIDFVKN